MDASSTPTMREIQQQIRELNEAINREGAGSVDSLEAALLQVRACAEAVSRRLEAAKREEKAKREEEKAKREEEKARKARLYLDQIAALQAQLRDLDNDAVPSVGEGGSPKGPKDAPALPSPILAPRLEEAVPLPAVIMPPPLPKAPRRGGFGRGGGGAAKAAVMSKGLNHTPSPIAKPAPASKLAKSAVSPVLAAAVARSPVAKGAKLTAASPLGANPAGPPAASAAKVIAAPPQAAQPAASAAKLTAAPLRAAQPAGPPAASAAKLMAAPLRAAQPAGPQAAKLMAAPLRVAKVTAADQVAKDAQPPPPVPPFTGGGGAPAEDPEVIDCEDTQPVEYGCKEPYEGDTQPVDW